MLDDGFDCVVGQRSAGRLRFSHPREDELLGQLHRLRRLQLFDERHGGEHVPNLTFVALRDLFDARQLGSHLVQVVGVRLLQTLLVLEELLDEVAQVVVLSATVLVLQRGEGVEADGVARRWTRKQSRRSPVVAGEQDVGVDLLLRLHELALLICLARYDI